MRRRLCIAPAPMQISTGCCSECTPAAAATGASRPRLHCARLQAAQTHLHVVLHFTAYGIQSNTTRCRAFPFEFPLHRPPACSRFRWGSPSATRRSPRQVSGAHQAHQARRRSSNARSMAARGGSRPGRARLLGTLQWTWSLSVAARLACCHGADVALPSPPLPQPPARFHNYTIHRHARRLPCGQLCPRPGRHAALSAARAAAQLRQAAARRAAAAGVGAAAVDSRPLDSRPLDSAEATGCTPLVVRLEDVTPFRARSPEKL